MPNTESAMTKDSRLSATIALAPATLLTIVEITATIYAALGGRLAYVEAGVYALLLAVPAGVLAALALILIRGRDRLLWCTLSISATFLALIFGYVIWGQATRIACHGAIDCPFG